MTQTTFEIQIDWKTDDQRAKTYNFVVSKLSHEKAELGGYKDLFRNTIFQNAYSQTDQPNVKIDQKFDRDTQTFDQETKSLNPFREFGSQTIASDLFLDFRFANTLKPKKYFNSDLWLMRRIEATFFIQKIIRGFLARKRMKNIKSISQKIDQEKNLLIKKKKEWIENAKIQEIEKRTHPKVILKS